MKTDRAVVVISGGLDSTTALRLSIEKYGLENVSAISFDYGQRQRLELKLAAETCRVLDVPHQIFQLGFLNQINQGFSANVDVAIEMPTIHDVLGDPQPVTYVSNRNMIFMSIAAAYAEANGFNLIVAGFQSNDQYNYHDTTPTFVRRVNDVLSLNRQHPIEIVCPFVGLSKVDEIKAILDLDGNVDLFKTTLTCYNPDSEGRSCGVCPSCAERLAAFRKVGIQDPIAYVQR